MKWLKEALRQILGLYCARLEVDVPKVGSDPRPMREQWRELNERAAAPAPPAPPVLVLVDGGKERLETTTAGGVVCPSCKREVTLYRRFADGRIECIPCPGRNGRRR